MDLTALGSDTNLLLLLAMLVSEVGLVASCGNFRFWKGVTAGSTGSDESSRTVGNALELARVILIAVIGRTEGELPRTGVVSLLEAPVLLFLETLSSG